jgi:hypothetical protein
MTKISKGSAKNICGVCSALKYKNFTKKTVKLQFENIPHGSILQKKKRIENTAQQL